MGHQLLAAVFCVTLLLASCGGSPETTTETSEETPTEETEETAETPETAEPAATEGEAATGTQCEQVSAVVREPYTTALIFTPTLEEEDGTVSRLKVNLLESKVEDAAEEVTEIQARIDKLEPMELTYPGLAEFRDSYVAQLQEIKTGLETAEAELSAIDEAFKTLNATDASPDAIASAEETIAAALNKDLPSNIDELSDKVTEMSIGSVADLLQICPPNS